MPAIRFIVALALIACGWSMPAQADIRIKVSIAEQKMHVFVDGHEQYVWPVATARRGMRTPTGTYHPEGLERKHRSTLYHNAPMPYTIFFSGNYAIHGSYDTVGRPASHGCVRLYPKDAEVLFTLVRMHGAENTVIVITSE